MAINFKEYTRIRDIIVKRNKRAAAAGLMPLIHFPTVKEIRKGYVDPAQALKAVKEYYSSGSQVKAIRQTGLKPPTRSFPEMPPEPKLGPAEKKAKQREYQRAYRRRKAVREKALTPAKARKYEGYLKALDTMAKRWKEAGFDLGISSASLSPSEAQAFVEYMEYRFAQGDFTAHYVIDEFIQDFSKAISKGHKADEIVGDFNKFLEDRSAMQGRANAMEGMSNSQTRSLWDMFIGD